MSERDGGPAFPMSFGPDGAPGYADGMSLRDWFAGQALVGMLAYPGAFDPYGPGDELHPMFARSAYHFADAMLAERENDDDPA